MESAVEDIVSENVNLNSPECDILKVQSKNIPELAQSDEASDNGSVVMLSSPEEPVEPQSLTTQVRGVRLFSCFTGASFLAFISEV